MSGMGESVHVDRKAELRIDYNVLCFREKVEIHFVPPSCRVSCVVSHSLLEDCKHFEFPVISMFF